MLAAGLDRTECRGLTLPRRVGRRFRRAVALVDRAEATTRPGAVQRKLRHVARLLDKTDDALTRLATHQTVADGCHAALSSMLTDGAGRALDLAASY